MDIYSAKTRLAEMERRFAKLHVDGSDGFRAATEQSLWSLRLEVAQNERADNDYLVSMLAKANYNGETLLLKAKSAPQVKRMLARGADPEYLFHWKTPLMIHVDCGSDVSIICALLEGGCNPHKRYEDGKTILHTLSPGHAELIPVLVGEPYNVDINAVDKNGQTAVDYYVRVWGSTSNLVQTIVACGATASRCDSESESKPVVHAPPVFHDHDLQEAYRAGNVAVLAKYDCHTEAKQLLKEGKADVHSVDGDGNTVLFFYSGRSGLKHWIDAGADVHALNKIGETPLDYWMKRGYDENVVALLRAGAVVRDKCKFVDYVMEGAEWDSAGEIFAVLDNRSAGP